MPATDLTTFVDALVTAADHRDSDGFSAAVQGIADSTPAAGPAEVQAALARLDPVLAHVPFGIGGDLAQLAGTMAEYGTDATAVLPTLVRRAVDVLEQAAAFERVHRNAFGAVPDPESIEQIEPTLDRFTADAARLGMTGQDATVLVQAWFCADQWVQPVLYLMQRKDVRAALPERARLTAAVQAVQESVGTAHWLYGLLLVLDDEPLVVLHRASGRGFRVTVSGVGDNFQLHTLLAAHLVGEGSPGSLPGRRPTAAEIAAATDGDDLMPAEGIRGSVNLVDAYGEWIWNEGRPADIPMLEGTRVVVVDPPPYERTWDTGRLYPLMRPQVTVEGALPPAEAARWLSLVKPPQRG